ncbi:ribosome small subunit-dependent GTPase A [Acetonema longum]|uniref:Small ribosomal subunit biogenesis GTPase RsgA n=1 Tax=Acetonema longum DSM 6540 TaxID=1009370 RepID=F7NFT8_9FIRM|nr:ribosome small subunit-dependent GTPase A [Acetonema longum]EGO65099.1 ribosome biogenesis GTPase RsgA [Acetonema longum DSM 6540]
MNQLIRYGATKHRFTEAMLYPGLHLARVVSQYKGRYKIVTEEGECLAEVSGKFRYETTGLSQYPAVGDFVMTDRTGGSSGNAVIYQVLTRNSVFERKAVGGGQQTQVIAANIDTVFICMSLNSDYNLSRLERYLAVAWNSGAAPVVVLTKADLCSDLQSVIAEIESVTPGTNVIITSSCDPSSSEKLLPYLQPGLTASFTGSSGVGKSTLINRLAGEELLRTSVIRQDDKGRHTTTRRELLVLPQGGIVIDTPGMRELGVESVDLAQSFSDIDDLSSHCRFRDCTHTTEPGCALLKALKTGTLDARRLESYRKLKREARYDGLSSRQIESEKLNAMFEDMGGMKKARKFIRQNNKRRRE